jgi:aminocarboxymuconate-semialdehyde decarboxylase
MRLPAVQTFDIHGHYVPRALMLEEGRPTPGVSPVRTGDDSFHFVFPAGATRTLLQPLIDLDARERWMDDQGVDVQVVSTWADLFGYGLDPESGTAWARRLNETLLEAIEGSKRYLALATLPMQSTDRAITLMEEALADGFVGVTIGSHIEGDELDDPRLDPFWEAASDLEAAVLIHPGYAPGNERTADFGLVNAVGRGVDTTIAASRLLFAGIPQRHSGVRIVLSHGGGGLPFLIGRLGRNREIDPGLHDPWEGLTRLWFDSVVFVPEVLRFLITIASPGSVLLGSDYPFPIGDPRPLEVVAKAGLDDAQSASVLGGSAKALLRITDEGEGAS